MTGRHDHDYSCGGGGSPRSGLSCVCLSTMFGKLLVHLVNTRLPRKASPRWRTSFRRSYPVKSSACCEAVPITLECANIKKKQQNTNYRNLIIIIIFCFFCYRGNMECFSARFKQTYCLHVQRDKTLLEIFLQGVTQRICFSYYYGNIFY